MKNKFLDQKDKSVHQIFAEHFMEDIDKVSNLHKRKVIVFDFGDYKCTLLTVSNDFIIVKYRNGDKVKYAFRIENNNSITHYTLNALGFESERRNGAIFVLGTRVKVKQYYEIIDGGIVEVQRLL